MLLLVTLDVRREAIAVFHKFEKNAARVMAKYGGAIKSAWKSNELKGLPESNSYREIHLVYFPDFISLEDYRHDPELLAWTPQREASILRTQIEVLEEINLK